MVKREIVYQWLCDKCQMGARFPFMVHPNEGLPVVDDPPKGWIRFNKCGRVEHYCPNCVEKIVVME